MPRTFGAMATLSGGTVAAGRSGDDGRRWGASAGHERRLGKVGVTQPCFNDHAREMAPNAEKKASRMPRRRSDSSHNGLVQVALRRVL
jgi:hypothetical protein